MRTGSRKSKRECGKGGYKVKPSPASKKNEPTGGKQRIFSGSQKKRKRGGPLISRGGRGTTGRGTDGEEREIRETRIGETEKKTTTISAQGVERSQRGEKTWSKSTLRPAFSGAVAKGKKKENKQLKAVRRKRGEPARKTSERKAPAPKKLRPGAKGGVGGDFKKKKDRNQKEDGKIFKKWPGETGKQKKKKKTRCITTRNAIKKNEDMPKG